MFVRHIIIVKLRKKIGNVWYAEKCTPTHFQTASALRCSFFMWFVALVLLQQCVFIFSNDFSAPSVEDESVQLFSELLILQTNNKRKLDAAAPLQHCVTQALVSLSQLLHSLYVSRVAPHRRQAIRIECIINIKM